MQKDLNAIASPTPVQPSPSRRLFLIRTDLAKIGEAARTASGQRLSPTIHPDVLTAISRYLNDGEEEIIRSLIQQFFAAVDKHLLSLKDAASRRDFQQTVFDAHNIQTHSLYFGAHWLAALADQIESAEGQLPEAELNALVPQIDQCFAEIRSVLLRTLSGGVVMAAPSVHAPASPSKKQAGGPGETSPPALRGRILAVEDSTTDQTMLAESLGEGFQLQFASSSGEALTALMSSAFDLVLIDVVLPGNDGFELCREIRQLPQYKDTPIVFITGKTSTADKVRGFSLGADDYVIKPFDPLELQARVSTRILRSRSASSALPETILQQGDLLLNLGLQKAYFSEDGERKEFNLTPIEFKLLSYFMRNSGRIINREELLSNVWGSQVFVLDRTIDKHICLLRRKLDARAHYIETLSRRGYRFTL